MCKPLYISILLLLLAANVLAANIKCITEPFDTVRFEIAENGKIFVSAYVNNDTVPLRFLFDTGAVDNILNTESQNALKAINRDELTDGKSHTTTSIAQTQITPFNNSITIGETEFQGVRFVLSPCSDDIDGIVGWNTLTGADFMIDYDAQHILFFDNGDCEIDDESGWLPLTFIDGLPSIALTFEYAGDNYATNVWLDSGSDRCMDLTTPFINEHNLVGKQNPWGISRIMGMEGSESKIEEVIASTIHVGPYQLYQLPLGLNLSNAGAAANDHFGGVIGNNLLQRFNQVWSFSKKRLYLQPNRRMYAAPYKPQENLLKNRVTLQRASTKEVSQHQN